jgi:adenine-specific DNA-methyltransferase
MLSTETSRSSVSPSDQRPPVPARQPRPTGPTPVEAITHADKRANLPTSDAQDFVAPGVDEPIPVRYPRDPTLDPQLVWRGKDALDGEDLVADAPAIYIQEKIDPRVIVENLRQTAAQPAAEPVLTLFDSFDGLGDLDLVEFYQHQANWSNRMILGDSLNVMASLAEREALRGKVQMIYIDPPCGIKFGSNWQASARKRDVKDGKLEDASREVEQIKAFRDTWQLGIHSYLTYLRDRLTAAKDLLTESGSLFVQIGDENVHLVRSLLDEVFGSENFVSLIAYTKTTSATSDFLGGTVDYLLWYARDRAVTKFHPLFIPKEAGSVGATKYDQVELADGKRIPLGQTNGQSGQFYALDNPTSQSQGREKGEGAASWFTVEVDGAAFRPTMQSRWKTNQVGMDRLKTARRLQPQRNTLRYVRFLKDFPAVALSNSWNDIGGIQSRTDPKIYVVQTATRAVERCMLMTTDPGDLVLDPTCGSGTTAYVAEQWGRRWIIIDTSRVALALARQRVMGARFPYFLLTDSPEGRAKESQLTVQPLPPAETTNDIRYGFVCERVQHVTLKSIANNPDIVEGMSREAIDAAIRRHAGFEVLYDKPYEDTRKVRGRRPVHGGELVAAPVAGLRRERRRRHRGDQCRARHARVLAGRCLV